MNNDFYDDDDFYDDKKGTARLTEVKVWNIRQKLGVLVWIILF